MAAIASRAAAPLGRAAPSTTPRSISSIVDSFAGRACAALPSWHGRPAPPTLDRAVGVRSGVARALLVRGAMRNTLLCSSILTAVLCGPALADSPAKPTGPPAADPSQMLRITLVVKAGADARTYELSISDRGCGSLSDKSAAHEDEIRVCSRPAAAGFLIDTDWKTRAGAVEYRTRSEMLVARGGGSGEVGRTGGLRLGVTVR